MSTELSAAQVIGYASRCSNAGMRWRRREGWRVATPLLRRGRLFGRLCAEHQGLQLDVRRIMRCVLRISC